jgi:hypothetical protein
MRTTTLSRRKKPMSRYTPNPDINPLLTIHTLEKSGRVMSAEIEYTVDIGGESSYGSVSLDDEEFDVQVDFDVSDVEDLTTADIDNLIDALVKYHPEHMSRRLVLSGPTDADAIKALMERMDELGAELNKSTIELAAIRRAAKMLTVAEPGSEQPANK